MAVAESMFASDRDRESQTAEEKPELKFDWQKNAQNILRHLDHKHEEYEAEKKGGRGEVARLRITAVAKFRGCPFMS